MRRPSPRDRGMMRRVTIRVIAAAAGITTVAAATLGATTSAASAATDSTLHVALDTQVSTFNPFLAYFDGELNVLGSIYPTLTSLDGSGKPVAYLAESWTTSSDQLSWTFKIRQGLKWTDGKPVTAKDAAWTLNLIMTNPVAASANGSLVSNFASVSAPDDSTLVIKTKSPQANMLYVSIPVSGIPIVPEHIWSSKVGDLKNFKNTSFPVVGYGPWILTGYKTDQFATLTANKDFYQGAPKYDKLILQYFKNSDAAVAALRSGGVDQVSDITATQFKALGKDKNIKTYQQVGNRWTAVEVNVGAKTRTGKPMGTGHPALQDQQLRLAIAYAMDRKTLVTKVLDGLGLVGAGYLPPAFPQWSWTPPADETIGYDPAKANQILDGAGYAKGTDGIRVDPKSGKPLSFRLGIHSDSTNDSQISAYIQGWLKAIGIKVTLQSQSMTVLNDNLAKGDWDMLMDGWGTGPDPTYLLGIQTCAALPQDNGTGGYTDAFFCDPEYDKMFSTQVAQFNQDERAQTIGKMQDILYKANADIVVYYSNGLSAVRTDTTDKFVSGSPDSKGFYPRQNVFRSWQQATPVSAAGSSHGAVYAGVGGVAFLVLLIGGGVAMRRRSTANERE
jgi:peptide/nickel transport system substrate-binding protein